MGKDSLGGKLGFGQFLSMKTFRVSFWQLMFVLQIVERNYFSASFCVLFSLMTLYHQVNYLTIWWALGPTSLVPLPSEG